MFGRMKGIYGVHAGIIRNKLGIGADYEKKNGNSPPIYSIRTTWLFVYAGLMT